jgi:hypothetical protein
MTIHAYTEPRGPNPAYINISERVSNPGDVIVTVRSSGENNASSIILGPDQFRALVTDAGKLLTGTHRQGMNFGAAIEALKRGAKVARAGWNGKGMWLILVPGTPKAELREGTPYAKALHASSCEILPHIDMWTVNAEGRRAMLPGWLASQSDMLADDWLIVEA